MIPTRTPVLVVGGSLVGLSTALFLAHHGVPCLLVERHPGTSVHPRAVGYYPRTVELLRGAGLEETLLKAAAGFAAHRTRAGVVSLAGAELFSREELDGADELADLTPCRLLLLTQDRLEPLLRARAEELGADLRFGVRLESFTQDATGVDAQLIDADGVRWPVRADWLVAADGPRSVVRERLGIERTGAGVMSRHVSIAFRADLREALRGRRFSVVHVQNPTVSGILVHDDTLQEGTLIVGYDPDRGEDLDDFTDDRCRTLVEAAIGQPGLPIGIRSRFPWDMAELTATRYVDGRVLLAGDAAHVVPPTGGYGANTGIADAHNLAWKLAAVLAGRAGAALVGSYDAERRPVGDYVARQGSLQLAVRSGKADASTADDALTVTMGYGYGTGSLAQDPRTRRAEPGTRAPHATVYDGRGEPTSTLDLFGTTFVLLSANPAWRAACDAGDPTVTAPRLDDARGEFEARFQLSDEGAVLVRPDGFVAWRTEHAPTGDPAAALRDALAAALHA